ncbi:hypothetical protein [Proteus mirabilis]|uniref:hypothetical protein n=2 Tax=Proteus mirabilis TaxID=584 RepID=UPI0003661889|nr:hypothetical protein [Proteus mirabilis]EKW2669844.1 hypothetical protein [Proteus mirabilis]ELA6688736.1 hypothetical protein [Proteus mirabilis]MDM3571482.1 hypothetical protein [Proteus mirabilis]HCU0052715.1 hypothetical protein [Proteus mirabilis]HEK1206265.1 hypothetical protein [Proteus mirabilis]
MNLHEAIEAIRTVSRDYNHNHQDLPDITHPDVSRIFEDNEYRTRLTDILNEIDENNAVKILNLIYIHREIEENESFTTCYQRMTRALIQNREHAILKVCEKLPVLDSYLSNALALANRDQIVIDEL